MSKNILIIRNAYAYDFGGGERFPVFLAKSLGQQGYEPTIISRHATLLYFAKTKGINTIRGWWWNKQHWNGHHAGLFPVYVLWQVGLYLWYWRLFVKLRPVAVHIQSKDDFIAATYAAKHLGIRVIWTDHADLKHIWRNIAVPFKNPVGKWVYKAAHKADAITVVSESELAEVTADLPELSPITNKLSVVYNGCADVLTNYPAAPLPDVTTYVIASRLVTDKGIGEAIKAFAHLHEQHPDTRLIVAGDGPEHDKFVSQAAGNDSIDFIGHQQDPYKIIAQADVFLQPTYHEGFSVVLVEASMLEKAIIATAVGGNTEIIHDNETGLLVPARDASTLEKTMERLYTDKNLRQTIAKQARSQYVNRFVFDTIVKESFIPLYDKTTR